MGERPNAAGLIVRDFSCQTDTIELPFTGEYIEEGSLSPSPTGGKARRKKGGNRRGGEEEWSDDARDGGSPVSRKGKGKHGGGKGGGGGKRGAVGEDGDGEVTGFADFDPDKNAFSPDVGPHRLICN